MEEKPKVSLLLLTLDRYQMTKYCLENILKTVGDIDYELLIFDNGSQDQRLKDFLQEQKHKQIFFSNNNEGISKGFNKLLSIAKGDYICFLSNDILVYDNWLLDLIHYNDQVERPGLTSIHCEGEKGVFGPLLSPSDNLINVWKPKNNITSGISLINRFAIDMIGGYDESLGIYGREREQFAYRLGMLAFQNYYIPDQYSIHLGRGVNDQSDYQIMKDKARQIASARYQESINEMRKNNNFKIEI